MRPFDLLISQFVTARGDADPTLCLMASESNGLPVTLELQV